MTRELAIQFCPLAHLYVRRASFNTIRIECRATKTGHLGSGCGAAEF